MCSCAAKSFQVMGRPRPGQASLSEWAGEWAGERAGVKPQAWRWLMRVLCLCEG